MDANHFGEGTGVYINKLGNKEIHQMTWRERVVYIFILKELFMMKIYRK